MVRERETSSDDTISSEDFDSSSSSDYPSDTEESFYSDESNEVYSDEDEDPFKGWNEFCECPEDYRGDLDEPNCPRCARTVAFDFDDTGSIDWSVFERNCTITKGFSKSFLNFYNSLWRTEVSDVESVIDEEYHVVNDVYEEAAIDAYFADDEEC